MGYKSSDDGCFTIITVTGLAFYLAFKLIQFLFSLNSGLANLTAIILIIAIVSKLFDFFNKK